MKNKIIRFLVAILILGCTSFAHAAGGYNLGPGDTIRITVYDHPELLTETGISESGKITFPLIGEEQVGGLTPIEAETKIASQLGTSGYIKNPHVNIVVIQYFSQQITVMGQVNKPGKYPVQEASTVIDLLALAGGVNQIGGNTAILIKHEQGKYTSRKIDLIALLRDGDMSQNYEVSNRDVIYVPSKSLFYVYGEVQRPGQYQLERNMTVAQGIALGGGLTQRGTDHGVSIKRRDASGKVENVKVQLDDLLEPDDVLVLKESLF